MDNRTKSQFIISMWYKENARLFGSQLVRPSLRIKALASEGEFRGLWYRDPANGYRETLLFDPALLKTKTQLHVTLVHEMIHQLQALQKSQRTIDEQHGRFFKRHAYRIVDFDPKLRTLLYDI